jgi:outer membrane receptor for ferrienterochelin and colicin
MIKKLFHAVMALTLSGAATISALAQADVSTATVKGIVVDPQGAAITNATVSIKDLAQGIVRTATTGSEGEFQIPFLRPGIHEITVEARGFSQYLLKDIQLTVGQTASFEIKMQVAGVQTEVVVTTEAPLIEIERTQQANTIENRQIENFPNISRDFTAYVFTLPGVSSSNAPRAQAAGRFTFGTSGFSIGGSNGRNNLITVDGGENEYGSGQLRFGISVEAIQEFQVNRNSFTAEFGFTAGTAVNVVTKSGTNDFHGSAYIYYRSNKTSAADPFNSSLPPQFRGKKAFEQQVYPGFTLGGPIVRNRLFFFTNYERLKSDTPRFRSYTSSALLQPTAAQAALLAGLDASADANVRRISANLRNALTTSSTSNSVIFNRLRESEGVFNAVAKLNNWNTRIDYTINERNSLSGRFSLTRNFTDQLGDSPAQTNSAATDLVYRDYTSVVTWTHNFSSSLINLLRMQLSPNNSALTIPRDPATTSLIIVGLANFGRPFTSPFNTLQDRYQVEESLTWIRSSHTFKFGASYRPVHYQVRNELWFSGEWQFFSGIYPITLAVPAADRPAFLAAVGTPSPLTNLTSLQSFNLNLPTLYRQGFNNPVWEDTAHYLGVFLQDTWKVHPRLTLDLGGRIDYDGEPRPVPKHTYFSPRLGFSWDVTGDRKTVVRGGGGLFYSPIYYQISYLTNILNDSGKFINQIARSGTGAVQIYAAGVALGKLPFKSLSEAELNAAGVQTGPKAPGRVVFELNPDYKNNYSIQASLGLQRQLLRDLSIELAYQMYRGVHIQQPVPLNYIESTQPNPRGPAFGPLYRICQVADRCPIVSDPTITQFTSYESRGNSIYHGLTASLVKRFSNSFSFQANYTFSKTIDDSTDFNSAFYPPFPSRLYLERSLSTFDIRHNFVFSGVFQSPFKNWALRDITLSPILFIRSGIPFTLLTGTDTNGDTRGTNDRLFYIGRNTGLGPNFRSVDLRLTRAFRFRSDSPLRIEFVAEAQNLFNRVNFSAVRDIIGTDLSAPDYNAGTVRLKGRRDRNASKGEPLGFTSAFDPRRVQLALKFVF